MPPPPESGKSASTTRSRFRVNTTCGCRCTALSRMKPSFCARIRTQSSPIRAIQQPSSPPPPTATRRAGSICIPAAVLPAPELSSPTLPPRVRLPLPDYQEVTGTSFAAAMTAGAAAILLSWSAYTPSAPRINTSIAKAFLIRGADRRNSIEYPSREWGYGTLNLYNSFFIHEKLINFCCFLFTHKLLFRILTSLTFTTSMTPFTDHVPEKLLPPASLSADRHSSPDTGA